jgi:hypothetical protein
MSCRREHILSLIVMSGAISSRMCIMSQQVARVYMIHQFNKRPTVILITMEAVLTTQDTRVCK